MRLVHDAQALLCVLSFGSTEGPLVPIVNVSRRTELLVGSRGTVVRRSGPRTDRDTGIVAYPILIGVVSNVAIW